jgi:hypothetical protein
MIQSKIILLYDVRDGQKSAFIKIAVKSWEVTEAGINYTVCDYAINGDVTTLIGTKECFRSWDQLNSLSDYLESINSYGGMTKKQTEFAKVQDGLLLDTQTNPVYVSTAADWEKTTNNDN